MIGSLRTKMILGMAGLLTLIVGLFSYAQYRLHRQMLLEVAETTAQETSRVIESGLRHAMLTQNRTMIQIALEDIAAQPPIVAMLLLNGQAEVRAASPPAPIGQQLDTRDVTCQACHAQETPRKYAAIIRLPAAGPVLRTCNPIENQPACYQCHDASQKYTGVLITDLDLADFETHARQDLQRTWFMFGGTLVLGTLLFSFLTERLVIRPLRWLTAVIRDFEQGNWSRRADIHSGDEMELLARTFNQMADSVQEKARLEEQVRQRTAELEQLYAALQEKEATRAQLLKQIINAQEAERKRIARELHDELAQALTGLIMSLETAQEVLGPEMQAVREQLARTREITARALDQTRHLILDLRPTMLDDLGLVPALRWYAETHLAPTRAVVAFRTEGPQRRLAPEIETTLFRIAQEAITNVVKHARARHVKIHLIWQPQQIILEVEDDGRGFDPDVVLAQRGTKAGMGLLGMRERAEMAGGRLEITSQPGQGTRVVAWIPTYEEEEWSHEHSHSDR